MRVLCSFVGGRGHMEPLLPIARAARDARHEVAFACRPSMTGAVAAEGFDAVAIGPDVSAPTARTPLRDPDPVYEEAVMRDGFASRTARARAEDLLQVLSTRDVDAIVADEVDFGAFLAAERLGIPYVSVVVLAAGGFARPDLLAAPLGALRAELGLPADPELTMLHRHLLLAPVPPSYRDPAHPLPASTLAIRPAALEAHEDRRRDDRPARPRVYVTLGTIFNMESGDLFERLLAAVSDVDADVLVTVGDGLDPEELPAVPEHVWVERFVPQHLVLPHADVVVSHGGSGSVIGALAHGVPLVLLPMGADQPHNARRCVELGVGRALDPVRATPQDLRDAIQSVLGDDRHRSQAQRLADESRGLPAAIEAVRTLEAIVAGR